MNTKKQLALECLATGQDISKAAEISNTSRPTIYKWLNDPAFKQELDRKQSELIQRLSLRLLGICELALTALEAGLQDRAITTRLRAAAIAISKLQSISELGVLEQRIAGLEARAHVNK
ncbi:MAG: hypothetical protein Q7U74_16180 [Saprospiraceae bacterium]|nr:hypothetical protein [Saprospiraceae bacterium]